MNTINNDEDVLMLFLDGSFGESGLPWEWPIHLMRWRLCGSRMSCPWMTLPIRLRSPCALIVTTVACTAYSSPKTPTDPADDVGALAPPPVVPLPELPIEVHAEHAIAVAASTPILFVAICLIAKSLCYGPPRNRVPGPEPETIVKVAVQSKGLDHSRPANDGSDVIFCEPVNEGGGRSRSQN